MSDEIDWDSLTFSLTPTDHMYITETQMDDAWMPGEMSPYGDMKISPAAGVLNYGQGLFEGMKAYRTSKDRVVFFHLFKFCLIYVFQSFFVYKHLDCLYDITIGQSCRI